MQQKIKRKKRISHVSIQKIKRKNLLVWVLFHVSMGFISCVEESSLHVSQYSMSAWVLFLVWKNLLYMSANIPCQHGFYFLCGRIFFTCQPIFHVSMGFISCVEESSFLFFVC
jgi:hypothetical protein